MKMVPDEELVSEEHFKAKCEMYIKFSQKSFSFNGDKNLILTVFCMQEMFSPHTSVPKRDYLLSREMKVATSHFFVDPTDKLAEN